MKICRYTTASVMLESEGYRIAVDPFLGIPLRDSLCRRRLLAVKYRAADAVLVTHGHFDHIMDIPRLYRDSDIKIFATKTPCKTLLEHGVSREKLQMLAPGISFKLGNFTITAYQGRHCRFDLGVMLKTAFKKDTLLNPKRLCDLMRLNRRYPENGETLFYEIEAEGKRVQLTGSMGTDIDTAYPTGADLLILPFQGTSDPASSAAPIILKLDPRMILLDHYDDSFPPMSSHIDTVGFTSKLLFGGLPAAAMKPGKVYEI